MTRRHLAFPCAGETLVGTLDDAPGATGLLIVTGGNEARAGAFAGQAHQAAALARRGYPVFRFDRRGVGDSTGSNLGFRHSGEDILAALATFRSHCPHVQRIVAYGNCDAASALMLLRGDMCDGLVLSNPWTFERDGTDPATDNLPPPAAIRARYLSRLRDPREWRRLISGGVNFGRLRNGVAAALRPPAGPTALAQAMLQGLDASCKPYVILIAGNDRTGQAFHALWSRHGDPQQGELRLCPDAGHAFAEPQARVWLEQQIISML